MGKLMKWRGLIVGAIALIISPLILFSVAMPAQAAGCSGRGCDGGDPVQTGCVTGAYTVASDYIYYLGTVIGRVDLRYSPVCETNWTRTISYIGPQSLDAVVTEEDIGYHLNEYLDTVTSVYTDMIYAPSPTCAQGFGIIYVNGTQYNDAGLWSC
ncbi:MAG: DUF2690 domain-containing protein [Streptosporangiaceae bacterium]